MSDRKRISTSLAEWSQVLSVILAIVGLGVAYRVYTHTVIPIFERDRVEEEKAHLEIQNEDASNRLKTTTAMLDIAKGDLAAANDSLADKNGEVAKLQSSLDKLREQQRVLVDAQVRLLATEFASAVADVRRDRTSGLPPSLLWPDAVSIEEKIWPHPFTDLSLAIDNLETRDRTRRFYAPETFRRLRRVLDRKRPSLICTPIDFDALRVEHKKLVATYRSASSGAAMDYTFQGRLETLRSECEKHEDTFVDGLSRQNF
jgi:hypothetical protein